MSVTNKKMRNPIFDTSKHWGQNWWHLEAVIST